MVMSTGQESGGHKLRIDHSHNLLNLFLRQKSLCNRIIHWKIRSRLHTFCFTSDPASGEQMNRIIRTKEFKDGTYQIMTDQASYDKAAKITYSNGAVNVVLPASDAQKLRDAYLKDMDCCASSARESTGSTSLRNICSLEKSALLT